MVKEFDKWFVDQDGDEYRWVAGRVGTVRRLFRESPLGATGIDWVRSDLKFAHPSGLKEALDFYWPEAQ